MIIDLTMSTLESRLQEQVKKPEPIVLYATNNGVFSCCTITCNSNDGIVVHWDGHATNASPVEWSSSWGSVAGDCLALVFC